jgi:hypothetical protein
VIRVLLLLVLAGAAYADGLGQLKQPDGTVTGIGVSAEVWGVTYTFPADAIPSRSWLTLPGAVSSAVLTTVQGRVTLPFPSVHAPDVRFAVQVPARLLSLTVRGTGMNGPLVRMETPPDENDRVWVLRSDHNTVTVTLPPWKTSATVGVTLRRSGPAPWTARISDGARARTFAFQPAVRDWSFFPDAWGFIPRSVTVSSSGSETGFDLSLRAFPAAADIAADPETILAWPPEAWRSPRREWFSWEGTSVLVLVTADYRVQDDYLKRLAFFVEKTGYRGRLVSDAEVARLHGWNAHDYAAPDLARFFALAEQQQFPLNAAELELRGRLAEAGVIRQTAQGWEAGTGALVGVSAESPPALRAVLFVHEAFHGLYYTSQDFRAGVLEAWQAMSDDTRSAFRKFLSLSRYDPSNEALMVNEFQAYTLQRRASEWASFFGERVLAAVPPSGRNGAKLSEFLTAARAIDALVGRLYGLGSGSVTLLRQESR